MADRFDSTGWMWARAVEMLDEAERLHRRFFQLAGSASAAPAWEPPVDVYRDDREIVIVVAMPGVPADRVQVASEAAALIVRGARPLPVPGPRHRVVQLEIPYGAFERRIALPPGTWRLGAPEMVAGCLIVRLARADEGPR
ncbi:MAG: Hsp20/alpha crystallin family protein [Burkholderiales bacterium]|jgi:HSP20 family molecular chaperone IbpA|nr:Hsp20/alpha crystallin family protein [Burkholderiales bacterium]